MDHFAYLVGFYKFHILHLSHESHPDQSLQQRSGRAAGQRLIEQMLSHGHHMAIGVRDLGALFETRQGLLSVSYIVYNLHRYNMYMYCK